MNSLSDMELICLYFYVYFNCFLLVRVQRGQVLSYPAYQF